MSASDHDHIAHAVRGLFDVRRRIGAARAQENSLKRMKRSSNADPDSEEYGRTQAKLAQVWQELKDFDERMRQLAEDAVNGLRTAERSRHDYLDFARATSLWQDECRHPRPLDQLAVRELLELLQVLTELLAACCAADEPRQVKPDLEYTREWLQEVEKAISTEFYAQRLAERLRFRALRFYRRFPVLVHDYPIYDREKSALPPLVNAVFLKVDQAARRNFLVGRITGDEQIEEYVLKIFSSKVMDLLRKEKQVREKPFPEMQSDESDDDDVTTFAETLVDISADTEDDAHPRRNYSYPREIHEHGVEHGGTWREMFGSPDFRRCLDRLCSSGQLDDRQIRILWMKYDETRERTSAEIAKEEAVDENMVQRTLERTIPQLFRELCQRNPEGYLYPTLQFAESLTRNGRRCSASIELASIVWECAGSDRSLRDRADRLWGIQIRARLDDGVIDLTSARTRGPETIRTKLNEILRLIEDYLDGTSRPAAVPLDDGLTALRTAVKDLCRSANADGRLVFGRLEQRITRIIGRLADEGTAGGQDHGG